MECRESDDEAHGPESCEIVLTDERRLPVARISSETDDAHATAAAVMTTMSSVTTQRRLIESTRTTQLTSNALSITSFPAATRAVPPFRDTRCQDECSEADRNECESDGGARIGLRTDESQYDGDSERDEKERH